MGQIDDAINAARAALPAWSMKTVEERLEIIKIYGTKLEEAKAHLAKVMAKETGKPERVSQNGKLPLKLAP